MKIKTSELSGTALDWAVAKATQMPLYQCGESWPGNRVVNEESLHHHIVTVGLTGRMLLEGPKSSENMEWSPSTNWAQGGPIIERERIQITSTQLGAGAWVASTPHAVERDGYRKYCFNNGPTPLIAAMRCFVANKLGDEVEIPQELLP